jgi:hypothetical protein
MLSRQEYGEVQSRLRGQARFLVRAQASRSLLCSRSEPCHPKPGIHGETAAVNEHRHRAATFGPGYALRSVTIQITDEPVTRGIEFQMIGNER